tara:strand:- start:3109 stop:3495 length:387 start_codon:yes stop_codon:yes gene_type:complete
MGNNLFGANISGLIKKHIGPGVLDATLTSVTGGTRTGGSLTGGTNPTTTDYACKGFIDTQDLKDASGTLVRSGSKVVVLLGDTINTGNTAPKPGDLITIESTVYIIPEDGAIDRDPDAATYTCEVRAR